MLIICLCISLLVAINRAVCIWKTFQTRQESIWRKIGFTILAFVMGAVIWPILPLVWFWNWLKEKKLLVKLKIKIKELRQQWRKYRGDRYIILAHSRTTDVYYTYGYIMPWWWRDRMEKTCNLFYFDEINKDKQMFFRVITEKEFKDTYYGKTNNYTDFAELMATDMVDSIWKSRGLGAL